MSIDNVRVSTQARDQLIRIKRHTGLTQWNVVCRWALLVSLAEPSDPPNIKIVTDSNVEMTWKTFAGPHSELYLALLTQHCVERGLGYDAETIAQQFKLHLHRGIGYLVGSRDVASIEGLLAKAITAADDAAVMAAHNLG